MSKIYKALQAAQGERLTTANQVNDEPTTPPSSSLSAFSTPRFYEQSELLALAQNLAARLPNPDQNVIQFIGSRVGEGTSTLIREFALTAAKHSSKPVLLVEADFYQPSQNQAFAIETKPPLELVLQEGKALDGVISQVEESGGRTATLRKYWMFGAGPPPKAAMSQLPPSPM